MPFHVSHCVFRPLLDQLVAMLSAAGATGGFDAGQSMAMAGFPANFTQFFPGAAAAQSSAQTSQQASRDASSAIGDYSRSIELDSGSGGFLLVRWFFLFTQSATSWVRTRKRPNGG